MKPERTSCASETGYRPRRRGASPRRGCNAMARRRVRQRGARTRCARATYSRSAGIPLSSALPSVLARHRFRSGTGQHRRPAACLTVLRSSSMLDGVGLIRRFTAFLLCLGVIAATVPVCGGWAPTAEARMACCAEGGACPMHARRSRESGDGHLLSQADADSCCASSERESSSSTTSTPAAAIPFEILGAGIVLPASVPALVLSNDWRTVSPIPTAPISRHVLLSVFLI